MKNVTISYLPLPWACAVPTKPDVIKATTIPAAVGICSLITLSGENHLERNDYDNKKPMLFRGKS